MNTASKGKTKLPYQLRFKFSGSIEDIEDWLNTNCNGAFSYNLEGVHETESIFSKLEVVFAFQHEADRAKFKSAIRSGEF